MTFLDLASMRWGARWAICRDTERNRERYGRCITAREYRALRAAYDRHAMGIV